MILVYNCQVIIDFGCTYRGKLRLEWSFSKKLALFQIKSFYQMMINCRFSPFGIVPFHLPNGVI